MELPIANQTGTEWVQKVMEETRQRVTSMTFGKTCYLVFVFSNVVCLSLISPRSDQLRSINVIDFLRPENDVSNGVKLGLFLSGACRHESLNCAGSRPDPSHPEEPTQLALPAASTTDPDVLASTGNGKQFAQPPVRKLTLSSASDMEEEEEDSTTLVAKPDLDEEYEQTSPGHGKRRCRTTATRNARATASVTRSRALQISTARPPTPVEVESESSPEPPSRTLQAHQRYAVPSKKRKLVHSGQRGTRKRQSQK